MPGTATGNGAAIDERYTGRLLSACDGQEQVDTSKTERAALSLIRTPTISILALSTCQYYTTSLQLNRCQWACLVSDF